MMRLAALLAAVALPAPAWAAPEIGLVPSVATIDDGAALVLNPAGLGTDPGIGLHLASGGFVSLGQQSYTLGLAFGAGGLGLRHEPAANGGDRQEFALATAIPLAPGFRGGLSYRLARSGAQSGADYDLGLLLRPFEWLSLGTAVRNVGGTLPGELRSYQLGLGVRPLGDRLTLSLDTTWAEGRQFHQSEPGLGVELEPLDGLFLRGQATFDPTAASPQAGLAARVGLAIATPRLDLGAMSGPVNPLAATSPAAGLRGGGTYLRFREARGRALWYGAADYLELELEGDLGPDRSALNLIAGLADKPPVASTLEVLDRAAADPSVKGIAITIEGVGVSLADVQEVRAGILAVRRAGKSVVAYLSSGSFLELHLASAADRILLNPVGMLDFTGFGTEDLYMRTMLEKIGIKAEFVSTGPYKTAMEPFMRDEMSDAQRQQLQTLIDDRFDQIVAGIAEGRRKTTQEVREQIDRGILAATEALDAGLVDDLRSRDELAPTVTMEPGRSTMDAFKRPVRVRSWQPARIAVIYASGAISSGDSGNDLLMGRILGEDTLATALRDAREDNLTKAVVLRIDSPGGGALAAETIRREVERTRLTKPVIVSMGGVAASGGYWIACGTERILADPGTVTGSIGVVVGKWSGEGLLGKVEAKPQSVTKGRFARLGSPLRSLTVEERALLQSTADFTYARFLELVSHARSMPQHKVKELAGGQVFSGRRAAELGLVDREAGLLEAISEARVAVGIAPSDEVEITYLPKQQPFGLSEDPLVLFDAAAQLRKAVRASGRWMRTSVWLLDPRLAPGD